MLPACANLRMMSVASNHMMTLRSFILALQCSNQLWITSWFKLSPSHATRHLDFHLAKLLDKSRKATCCLKKTRNGKKPCLVHGSKRDGLFVCTILCKARKKEGLRRQQNNMPFSKKLTSLLFPHFFFVISSLVIKFSNTWIKFTGCRNPTAVLPTL